MWGTYEAHFLQSLTLNSLHSSWTKYSQTAMKKELLLISVKNSKWGGTLRGWSQTSEQDKARFEHQSKPLGGGGGLGACPLRKCWNLEAQKCSFMHFPWHFFQKSKSWAKIKTRQLPRLAWHAIYSPALNHMNSVHMYQFHQIEREREITVLYNTTIHTIL